MKGNDPVLGRDGGFDVLSMSGAIQDSSRAYVAGHTCRHVASDDLAGPFRNVLKCC